MNGRRYCKAFREPLKLNFDEQQWRQMKQLTMLGKQYLGNALLVTLGCAMFPFVMNYLESVNSLPLLHARLSNPKTVLPFVFGLLVFASYSFVYVESVLQRKVSFLKNLVMVYVVLFLFMAIVSVACGVSTRLTMPAALSAFIAMFVYMSTLLFAGCLLLVLSEDPDHNRTRADGVAGVSAPKPKHLFVGVCCFASASLAMYLLR
jgi:MFS family permease